MLIGAVLTSHLCVPSGGPVSWPNVCAGCGPGLRCPRIAPLGVPHRRRGVSAGACHRSGPAGDAEFSRETGSFRSRRRERAKIYLART